jgi:hypothetical protein
VPNVVPPLRWGLSKHNLGVLLLVEANKLNSFLQLVRETWKSKAELLKRSAAATVSLPTLLGCDLWPIEESGFSKFNTEKWNGLQR